MNKRINKRETRRRVVAAAEEAEKEPEEVDLAELSDKDIIRIYGTMLIAKNMLDLEEIENEINRRRKLYLREMLENEGLIAYEEEGQQDG